MCIWGCALLRNVPFSVFVEIVEMHALKISGSLVLTCPVGGFL